jgi:hypothetical protein
MLSVGSLREGKVVDMRNVMAAFAYMREMAGFWMDFTGLFFIVTWISSIVSATQVPVSSCQRASLPGCQGSANACNLARCATRDRFSCCC